MATGTHESDHFSRSKEEPDTFDRHSSSQTDMPEKDVEDNGAISPSTETSNSDQDIEKHEYDGHRPTRLEIQLSRTNTRPANGKADNDFAIQRTLSRRQTALSKIRSTPQVQFRHPLEGAPTGQEVIVDFDGKDDPYRPVNWPTSKKVFITAVYSFLTMSASWASASFSAGNAAVAKEFDVGNEVAVLGTTLFLLGFGIGPLIWAPISELYGRRNAVFVPMFLATCFSFATATAKDLQTIMLTRFFGAFCASAPVTNTGGVLGDLWTPAYRGIAMAGYAMAVVGGPSLGPIVSAAFVAQPSLGWRWTEYFTGILQGSILAIGVIFADETYPPRLLVAKAARLRHDTGNWALHAKFEEWNVSFSELVHKFGIRPLQLLVTPICFFMALYASFCYGILYMQLGAIPIIFGEIRGWSPFVATLPFLALFLGAVAGAVINIWNQVVYNRYYHAAGDVAVPERRLPPMMFGSFVFCGGQFLTGWTATPSIQWIVPVIGLFLVAMGFFMIFQAALNYLVDTFQPYAASAVAVNTFLRSCFAGAFPLVVTPLYHNIGTGPGTSITGGFAALLIPVPFVFFKYGERIRARGKWSRASVVPKKQVD